MDDAGECENGEEVGSACLNLKEEKWIVLDVQKGHCFLIHNFVNEEDPMCPCI